MRISIAQIGLDNHHHVLQTVCYDLCGIRSHGTIALGVGVKPIALPLLLQSGWVGRVAQQFVEIKDSVNLSALRSDPLVDGLAGRLMENGIISGPFERRYRAKKDAQIALLGLAYHLFIGANEVVCHSFTAAIAGCSYIIYALKNNDCVHAPL